MAGKEKGKLHIHINLGTLVFLVIVVYLMAYMLTYIGKDKLAIYEVSASDIVDNIEGTGVILRQENLVNAAQDGYINYYVQDGAMVNKNGVVYMIDTTGEIQDYLKKGIPVMVAWNDWGGHWQVIIGYDTMGTETTQDDVLIVADSYDTTDHNQDGYGIYPAERFYYNWTMYDFFSKNYGIAERDKLFIAVEPKA